MGAFFRSYLLKLEKIIVLGLRCILSLIITGFSNSEIFAVIFFKGKSEICLFWCRCQTTHRYSDSWVIPNWGEKSDTLWIQCWNWGPWSTVNQTGKLVVSGWPVALGSEAEWWFVFSLFFCYANLKSMKIQYTAITQYLSITIITILL